MLHVTHHAVERFIKYWRRGMPWLEARECLEALAARSSRSKRKTRRDAGLRIATTERGERIPLVVRGRTVVTVLAPGCRAARMLGIVAEQHRTTLESVEAERARLAERVESECAKRKAEAIVSAWDDGAVVRPKALRRARDVLGMGTSPNDRTHVGSREVHNERHTRPRQ
jgi:hypothetical protein